MTRHFPDDGTLHRAVALVRRVAGASSAGFLVVQGGRSRMLAGEGGPQEVPLAVAETLLRGDVVAVPDVQHDPRFSSLVAKGVGLLVAAPVRYDDGAVVGSLVAMDTTPRDSILAADLQAFESVATMLQEGVALRGAIVRAQEAEAEALATGAAKHRVTSRLSHDLRTPMTAILGFGQLLRLEELSANGTESVDHLLSAARKLLGMIDEVLDLNRLDQGEHEVALEALALPDVVNVAGVAVRADAASRNVSIVIDPSCEEHQVRTDRRRLQQVVVSLLGNILERAKPGGSIRIAASATDGRVRVTIQDEQPPGGAPSHAPSNDGTRDGLTLSKRLMEAMDGDVGAEHDGRRAYWLDLPSSAAEIATAASAPSAPATAQPPTVVAPPDVGGDVAGDSTDVGVHTLLYIEDDPANQRLVTRMFAKNPNIEVLSAIDGRTGLDYARTRAPGVVLLDLGLPDVSGREVLATLKADEATAGIPVVVLSGEAEADRPGELERAGAAAYVTKPFNVRAMIDLVGGFFDEGAA